jgi:hypothetical protein
MKRSVFVKAKQIEGMAELTYHLKNKENINNSVSLPRLQFRRAVNLKNKLLSTIRYVRES